MAVRCVLAAHLAVYLFLSLLYRPATFQQKPANIRIASIQVQSEGFTQRVTPRGERYFRPGSARGSVTSRNSLRKSLLEELTDDVRSNLLKFHVTISSSAARTPQNTRRCTALHSACLISVPFADTFILGAARGS